ncbi:hypothetical protein [Thalassospira alkalitolerans]|jgi:hypothetical protein|uniref:hypothetical protein n=1 Tax=Thalassospira alkalitolerans TaxID=1293890 RepID=UPI0030ED1B11|tara:strand:- start:271 stop:498 length:228 start_codon:yes stop_codon:yes gene_type:complete
MGDLNARTYYQMHQAIESILKLVRHEMYKDERTGTIPPDAIAEVADEIRMQVTWLDMAEDKWERRPYCPSCTEME